MKILSLMAGTDPRLSHDITHSTLHNSTPFGFDLIIANASDKSSMYGSSQSDQLDSRWKDAINKWANGKRKIIIFLDNLNSTKLAWLPIDSSTRLTLNNLSQAGSSNYIGNIVSTTPLIRRFLTDNKENFHINTYLNYQSIDPNISINSHVDSTLVTSFTYHKDNVNIIFIPRTVFSNLNKLFSAFDTPANTWGLEEANNLIEQLSVIDSQINSLHETRDSLFSQLNHLNENILKIIESDIYLSRAIGHYDATKATESPSPEAYYGAVESIENAFASEREMREELSLTKAFIDKVMRRANEFRHESKSGQPPTPLTTEEVTDLNLRVSTIISAYIQYLMKK